jgi:bis(5'-nucleosidyl)-tetraphosphatase
MTSLHSAGAVIFRREEGMVYYLLLQYSLSYWGLAKGGIEKGEKVEETAAREIQEETGLSDIHFVDGFKVDIGYFFKREGQKIFKDVSFLLAETCRKDVKISFEHIGYIWLPFKEAVEKVTFQNEKKLLQLANDFVSGRVA